MNRYAVLAVFVLMLSVSANAFVYSKRLDAANYSCYSSAPNSDTGDVAAGKSQAGYTNVTDRDVNTYVALANNNYNYVIDLLSTYTINQVNVSFNTGGLGGGIYLEGSGNNLTFTRFLTLSGHTPAVPTWVNISVQPIKNVRFIRLQRASSVATNVHEIVVSGYPENCSTDKAWLFGTPVDYGLVLHESSESNANNTGYLHMLDEGGNDVPLSAGAVNNFGVWFNTSTNYGYFVNDTSTISKVWRFSGSGSGNPVDWGFTRAKGTGTYRYSLIDNGTSLFVFDNRYATVGQASGLSRLLLSNGVNVQNVSNSLSLSTFATDTGGAFIETPGIATSLVSYAYSDTGGASHTISFDPISGTIAAAANFTPAATPALGLTPYNNGTGWRYLFGTVQDGNYEIYDVDYLGLTTARRLSTTDYDEVFNWGVRGAANYTNGNAYAAYINDTDDDASWVLAPFCTTVSSPALGQPCDCPSGYSYNGVQCIYTGLNASNVSYNRVELYIRDYCTSQLPITPFWYCDRAREAPSCPNVNPADNNRDYVQLQYLINGQDAYNITNGSAYCVGTAYLSNFSFVYKLRIDGTTGFEKDVNFDLADENASAFCPDYGSLDCPICLRNQLLEVSCYANDSSYSDADISNIFWVRGTQQDINGWTTQFGTGGTYSQPVPVSSSSIDIKTDITYQQRYGDLQCAVGFGTVGVSQFGGPVTMVNNREPLADHWTASIRPGVDYPGATYSLQVGDNRVTEICSQSCGVSSCDPVQNKIIYDKFTAWNDCEAQNGTAWLQDGYFYLSDLNGTHVLNVSYPDTNLTTTDAPFFRVQHWIFDGSGQRVDTSASCSYTVLNATDGLPIPGETGILVPYEDYYRQRIYGPEELNGLRVWPQAGTSDGINNYTLQVSCNPVECSNIATYTLNFSVSNNPCMGTAESCYMIDPDNVSAGCYNCFSQPSYYTCDDGYNISSNAYSCHYSQCIPQIDACTACAAGGHLGVNIIGSLNKQNFPAINPDIKYRVNFYNSSPANIIPTAPLNPSCKVFIVPNAGPSLPGCEHFSWEHAIPGFDYTLCGYEYTMSYDVAADQMVWNAPAGIELQQRQAHTIFAACTGNFAANSSCGFRVTHDTFTIGGPGRCPNSVVNITDGGYTDENACFPNTQYLCRPEENPPYFADPLSCGCPAGQTYNASVVGGCQGTATPQFGAYMTLSNFLLFIIVGPGILILAYGYLTRQKTGGTPPSQG